MDDPEASVARDPQPDVDAAALLAEREAELANQREANRRAVARTRDLLLAGDPAVPAEMVSGETLDEVEASFARAKEIVGRVRAQVEVGAGAPGRITAAPATAFEKIRSGLAALE